MTPPSLAIDSCTGSPTHSSCLTCTRTDGCTHAGIPATSLTDGCTQAGNPSNAYICSQAGTLSTLPTDGHIPHGTLYTPPTDGGTQAGTPPTRSRLPNSPEPPLCTPHLAPKGNTIVHWESVIVRNRETKPRKQDKQYQVQMTHIRSIL